MGTQAKPQANAASTSTREEPASPYPSPTDFPPADPERATSIVVCAGQAECRFRVTQYDGERIHKREMSEAEMRQIDPESVHLYLNEPEGRLVYKGADGKPQEPKGWPGLVGQEVLRAIQSKPGIFLSPRALTALTGIHALAVNGTVATHVMRLRILLGEQGGPHRLVESRRVPEYGIRWPRGVSWVSIVLVPTSPNGAK